jgi:hypothetical protein
LLPYAKISRWASSTSTTVGTRARSNSLPRSDEIAPLALKYADAPEIRSLRREVN